MEQTTEKDSKEASTRVWAGEVLGVEVSKAVNLDYAPKGVHEEQACRQGKVHEIGQKETCACVTFTRTVRKTSIKSKVLC